MTSSVRGSAPPIYRTNWKAWIWSRRGLDKGRRWSGFSDLFVGWSGWGDYGRPGRDWCGAHLAAHWLNGLDRPVHFIDLMALK